MEDEEIVKFALKILDDEGFDLKLKIKDSKLNNSCFILKDSQNFINYDNFYFKNLKEVLDHLHDFHYIHIYSILGSWNNLLKNPKYSKLKSNPALEKFLKYKQIGEGRFGKIYSCAKISEVGQYAVKIYNKISENQKKRIKKKLDVLYSLNHQNILKAISFNQDELFEEFGGFCILYESVNYRNVDDLIKEFKIFEEFDEKLLKIYME